MSSVIGSRTDTKIVSSSIASNAYMFWLKFKNISIHYNYYIALESIETVVALNLIMK